MVRVPGQNPDQTPAMPTKASRGRRWVKEGKATAQWNNAGLYYVRPNSHQATKSSLS